MVGVKYRYVDGAGDDVVLALSADASGRTPIRWRYCTGTRGSWKASSTAA
ncbi:MAG: hypothetical protein IPO87_13780 [Flavobacteriales bacterium]|nr:hypothetical protein [Flavobacteriales bacterium]